MQSSDMSRRIKIQVGDVEFSDIIRVGEIFLEDIKTEVPSLRTIVTVKSGVTKIPPIPIAIKIRRDSSNLLFLNNWRDNDEVKDVSAIEIDGHGEEYDRMIFSQCELVDRKLPEYAAENPTFAQAEFTLLPLNIIDL